VIYSSDGSSVSVTTCADISITWVTTFEILVPLAIPHSPFSGSRLDMWGDESGELGLGFGLRERRVIRWSENRAEVVLTG
jgi:hypothetical protein